MKTIFIVAISFLVLFINHASYACGNNDRCRRVDYCQALQNRDDCECADKGYRYNTCISKSRYCQAFGNIGRFD